MEHQSNENESREDSSDGTQPQGTPEQLEYLYSLVTGKACKTHIVRPVGQIFIKRCKHCSTRTHNRVEADGAHLCFKCGKINLKASQL